MTPDTNHFSNSIWAILHWEKTISIRMSTGDWITHTINGWNHGFGSVAKIYRISIVYTYNFVLQLIKKVDFTLAKIEIETDEKQRGEQNSSHLKFMDDMEYRTGKKTRMKRKKSQFAESELRSLRWLAIKHFSTHYETLYLNSEQVEIHFESCKRMEMCVCVSRAFI